jgi:Uma2 family endonuclease
MAMSGSEQRSSVREAAPAAPEAGVVIEGRRYLRAPAPLHFPAEAEVPETKRHLELRTLLYQFLKLAFSARAAIGCDQFVYWDPTDPRACLAPDAFVRCGEANDLFRTWNVWERGAPHVAVEIVSESDEAERAWDEKLERYRRLGVSELVRFDPADADQPLRVWDLVTGELLERQLSERRAHSRYLDGFWLAIDQPDTGLSLRLSLDERGERLFPTLAEQEAEGRRAEAEGRRIAEQRVLELEAELRQREP